VVGVQDEQQIQRLGGHGRQLQRARGDLEHHVQEAVDVLEVVARIAVGPADRIAVAGGCNGRHLGDQADRRQATLGRVFHVQAVVVEGRERADHAAQHGHRVRIVAEAAEEVLQGLVHHRVMRDLVLEALELGRGRQLALHQQVGDLQEARMLGQLLDGVAAVQQHALITVDVGDRAAAAGSGDEARIIGEVACFLRQLADVDAGRAERAAQQGKLGALAGSGIGEREALALGHG